VWQTATIAHDKMAIPGRLELSTHVLRNRFQVNNISGLFGRIPASRAKLKHPRPIEKTASAHPANMASSAGLGPMSARQKLSRGRPHVAGEKRWND
jgi:hypothetical protein